jgi:putative thioredoxin
MSASNQPAAENVIEPTVETFTQDVIERSKQTPVVIDFWAEWCQPCRLLAPILEKLAAEFQGKFVLAKVNVDQQPDIAASFNVESIPAVYAVRDGAIADMFVGVRPEPQLREWIERILPTPADTFMALARQLEATDPPAAEAKYRAAIELSPREPAPKISLARLLLNQGRLDDSHQLIEELAARGYLEPEAEKIKAEVDLRRQGQEAGSVDACRAAVAAQPADRSLQFKLAESLAAAGSFEEALQTALLLVQQDRKQTGEQARELMVRIFQTLPADSELTTVYRRKLSAALY